MNKIIRFYKSIAFIFLGVLFVICPLILHTEQVFYKASCLNTGSRIVDHLYAFFFAVGFDWAVLAFIINNQKKNAIGFALVTFIINVLYFNPGHFISAQLFSTIAGFVLSAIGAYIIYSYSELFYKRINEPDHACKNCAKPFTSEKALAGHLRTLQ